MSFKGSNGLLGHFCGPLGDSSHLGDSSGSETDSGGPLEDFGGPLEPLKRKSKSKNDLSKIQNVFRRL